MVILKVKSNNLLCTKDNKTENNEKNKTYMIV